MIYFPSPMRLALVVLPAVASCSSASILEHADAACVRVNVDGYFTDSTASGLALKLPDGVPIDAATVRALCDE